ncbi:hypothetical protein DZA50_04965 [Kangiella sp. HD9-110m-PIT-SAG07]|nr:hypothetical protein DZA50_04965 [Kangiella sp. HD9-110m-PIT-SAG07]
MNTLGKLLLGLSGTFIACTAAASHDADKSTKKQGKNYVMTSPVDYRSYKSSHGSVVTTSVVDAMGANWKQYTSYFGREGQWLWLSDDGQQVYWMNKSQQLDLLLDINDSVGTEYSVRIDGCTDRAVLAQKSANIGIPAGSFDNAIRLDFSGYCHDAGLKSAWFVPSVGLVKWTEDSLIGSVVFELEHAKVGDMTLPNQDGIELSAQFPAETVMLNKEEAIEASITLINHSDEPIKLDFTSGQTFEIYLYDDQDTLVSLWSSDMMFTQALHSMEIKPGGAERFGGELALKDLDGQPLDIGSYKIKIQIKGSYAPGASSYSHIPLSAESVVHLDNMMTHY